MSRELREIAIGAAVAAVLVCVLFFLQARHDFGSISAGKGMTLKAKFNKVDGVVVGSDVRLGGIKIGRVAHLALDDRFRAVMTFEINEGVGLPTDTSASVHTDGLFGAKFVGLEPGGEDHYIKSGGEINFTQDALVVSDLLELIISEGHVARKAAESQQ